MRYDNVERECKNFLQRISGSENASGGIVPPEHALSFAHLDKDEACLFYSAECQEGRYLVIMQPKIKGGA